MGKTKCLECFELKKTFIDLDMNPLESIIGYVEELEEFVGINDEVTFEKYNGKVKCSECGERIGFEDYFIQTEKEELFTKEVGKIIGEYVSTYVHYCKECEIVKGIEEVNNISMMETGQKLYIEGRNVQGFLEDHFVPFEFTNYVIPYLSCRCCGYGYDKIERVYNNGSFDDSFSVYNQEEISGFLEIDMDEWSDFSEKYYIYIKSFELTNFLSYLKKNPMLAFKHSVGGKLYDLFSAMYNAQDYIILNNEILFRGRTRIAGSEMYKETDMWSPPFGVSSHGRYNIVGTSVLYLANNKNIIPYELNYVNSQEIDVAAIEVIRPLKILDLSYLIGDFGKFLSQSSHNTNVLKLEYLLTNFISECCREIGFNGIKYRSAKGSDYHNFAFLNFEVNKDLKALYVENLKVTLEYKI
ncbi:RES domain-containing protein [Priestia flexa]|uniref:RES domain-containing protein n=1 Tax=Priestia flexa TaxID=86664 RepID=UPI0013D5F33F|nr:RES domain-containing protein [Priestia flexa]